MANQAAKKAQRSSISLQKTLLKWIIPINIIHFSVRFLHYYAEITKWTVIGSLFLLVMLYFSHSWTVAAAQEGMKSEYAMDVFILTLTVQLGVTFTGYFWILYLMIPGFLLYKGGNVLVNYAMTPDKDPVETEKEEKRRAKKERQSGAAGRIRYARR